MNQTPYGKIIIIKSLLIYKITHMLLCLLNPNVLCVKEISNATWVSLHKQAINNIYLFLKISNISNTMNRVKCAHTK